jgi:Raf kinase inhibitor-like YbhB/YbcL family protein
MSQLIVKSSVFEANKLIPKKYSCDGENVNPPLTIAGLPKETKNIVLIMDDPDAPMGTFDHWVVWNIPASTNQIAENSAPGIEGLNGMRKHGYTGPCPPSGTHRYFFKVYAIDSKLDLPLNSTKHDVEKAMQSHILTKGEIVGLFKR